MRITLLFMCCTLFFPVHYHRLTDDASPVDPRKSANEYDIKIPLWLFRSLLILIQYLAFKFTLYMTSTGPSQEPGSQPALPKKPEPDDGTKILATEKEHILEKPITSTDLICTHEIQVQRSMSTHILLNDKCPSPSMDPVSQDAKENPRRKYKVGFSSIVWVRTIPNDNIGRKARSSKHHTERFLIYQRPRQPRTSEPGNPEPRTPEPGTPEPRASKSRNPEPTMPTIPQPRGKRRRFFCRCLRGEED